MIGHCQRWPKPQLVLLRDKRVHQSSLSALPRRPAPLLRMPLTSRSTKCSVTFIISSSVNYDQRSCTLNLSPAERQAWPTMVFNHATILSSRVLLNQTSLTHILQLPQPIFPLRCVTPTCLRASDSDLTLARPPACAQALLPHRRFYSGGPSPAATGTKWFSWTRQFFGYRPVPPLTRASLLTMISLGSFSATPFSAALSDSEGAKAGRRRGESFKEERKRKTVRSLKVSTEMRSFHWHDSFSETYTNMTPDPDPFQLSVRDSCFLLEQRRWCKERSRIERQFKARPCLKLRFLCTFFLAATLYLHTSLS